MAADPLADRSAAPPIPTLALRPREAAKALGVSERTLWAWTAAGDVPVIRKGKVLLYSVAAMEKWLAAQADAEGVTP